MRSMFGEFMPKEILAYIKDLFDVTREEIVRILSKEFKDFLSHIELEQELRKILTTMVVDVKLEVRFREDTKQQDVEPVAPRSADPPAPKAPAPDTSVDPPTPKTKKPRTAPKKKPSSPSSDD